MIKYLQWKIIYNIVIAGSCGGTRPDLHVLHAFGGSYSHIELIYSSTKITGIIMAAQAGIHLEFGGEVSMHACIGSPMCHNSHIFGHTSPATN